MPRQTQTTTAKNGKSAKKKTKQDSDIHSQVVCPACHGKKECPVCGGTKKVKCARCHGRGKENCPVCHSGYITKTQRKTCAHCHGTGRVYVNTNAWGGEYEVEEDAEVRLTAPRPCKKCDGEGEIEETYEELCPNCHGDYKDFKKCTACNGKKTVACYTCHGTGEILCPLCEGKEFSTIEDVCARIAEMIGANGRSDFCDDWGESWLGEFLPVLTDAANHGVGIAMHVLGLFYWGNGRGDDFCDAIPCDMGKAATWFHKAAEHGIADAQVAWGDILDYGKCGVEEDLNEAFEWYKKAAEQRHPFALMKVAESYVDGHLHGSGESRFTGVTNYENALAYFRIIIEESHKHPEDWDANDVSYAEKHVELLPKIINGDSDAIDAMHGWILGGWKGENGSRRGRFEFYWKLMAEREARRRQEDFINKHRKKRWLFVLIAIFFGLLGLQFVYARRWKFFFAHWALFVAAIIWMPKVFSVCIALWLGSLFFMKHDGNGNRM